MCSVLLRRNTRNQIRKGRKLQFMSALRLRARFCLTSHANTFCKPLPKYTYRIAPNIRFKSRQLPILTEPRTTNHEPRSHYTVFFPFRQSLFYTKTVQRGKFLPYATFRIGVKLLVWAYSRKGIVETVLKSFVHVASFQQNILLNVTTDMLISICSTFPRGPDGVLW